MLYTEQQQFHFIMQFDEIQTKENCFVCLKTN